MRQYWDIKSLHPDKVLLFRMGDFFEMFHEDAVLSAPIVGIALTQRNKKSQDETPMCGVPHHSIAGPINKLLQRGLKVAICDQAEPARVRFGWGHRGIGETLWSNGVLHRRRTRHSGSSEWCGIIDSGIPGRGADRHLRRRGQLQCGDSLRQSGGLQR